MEELISMNEDISNINVKTIRRSCREDRTSFRDLLHAGKIIITEHDRQPRDTVLHKMDGRATLIAKI